MGLKLVPFNTAWIQHDKIDIHAIYRRPRFVQDQYGEWNRERDAQGLPTWDITGPLPVRSHNRWAAKGFQYITLANRVSLHTAARFNTLPPGLRASDFDQHQDGGPWNYKKYVEGIALTIDAELKELEDDIDQFGSLAVETVRRRMDPAFELPKHLTGLKAGDLSKQKDKKQKKDAEVPA